MQQYTLSNEEIAILKKYGEEFRKWLDSENGKNEMQDHRAHSNYIKSILSSQNLPKLAKSDLIELYKNLWASHVWKNKDWNINQIIEKNGFDNLKNQLYKLLYGTESFEKRYDSFREKIKGFGISIISEILNMIYPENYCLWNNKTKTVLKFLNLKQNLPERLFKYNLLTGQECSQCIRYLNTIKNELSSFQIVDFVDVDIFFWYIHENIIPRDWKKDSKLEYQEDEEENELQGEKKSVDLEKLILEYDKNKELFGKSKITEKEAMELRSQFVSDFPIDKILDIEIDNYVVGKKLDTGEPNRKTFCYTLEFGLPGFGTLGGGGAEKFGIYYDYEEKRYIYNENKFHSPEEAYKEIITQINLLIDSGKQFTKDKNWKRLSSTFESVDGIKRTVKSKILAVYFPESIVSINTHYGTKHILKLLFHLPDEEITEEFMLNKKRLWEIKENHPIMRNWSNFDYSTFAWYAWKNYFDTRDDGPKSDDMNQFKTGFWVVRAGSGGGQENDSLGNDVVTIQWDGLLDISHFKDKHNLKSYYRKIFPDESHGQVVAGAGQVWSFLNEIKKDDIVILPLMSRHSKTVAIGVIVGDYEFREINPDIKHIRKVKWLHKNIPINKFSDIAKKSLHWRRTVYKLENQEALKSIKEIMKKYSIFDGFVKEPSFEYQNLEQSQQSIITFEKLSQIIYISEEKLKNIQKLLEDKKQVIFYGPPGTSKTFVAKKFAEYFVNGKKENVEIIQFHPSYSYEDFVEGIKPRLSVEDEATGFVKQSGIFKNLVDKCIKNQDENFVLIIDEINRGNISKIFGELIYLLEYRNDKIRLTYSPNEEFYIPSNLYIIGTMNSADRSIAFVDYALRRRFYFIDFYPDAENEDILKKWFLKNGIRNSYQNLVIELLREINTEISKKLGREYQIGYSYFMNKLDYEIVKRIIYYAIIPLIEQYFFGKKENVDIVKNICNTYLIRLQDFEKGKQK